ncbi:MAG: nuclear transport factor 2 family protein [Actinomycetota bacterium]|jgi:ketosteroid isomerase-like protein|nr:nuclear transport factor 2 family protein [Actinomycetota bacterium]
MPAADHDALEEIRSLKHAYFRLLDTKDFAALGDLLTDDVTTSYEGGKHQFAGRDQVVDFLERSLGDPGIVHAHTAHHPEIVVTADDAATGIWYLEDRVIVPAADFVLSGTALYEDTYSRTAAGWRIRHTGYRRIYEEHRRHSTGELLSFTSRFGAG